MKKSKDEIVQKHFEKVELFNTTLHKPKLVKKNNKPYGTCVFFDGKGCAVHEVKPLGCKVGNCKEHGENLYLWFMLNHIIDNNDPEAIRQFASYLQTGGKTLEGGQLKDLVKDKERLKKILSYGILK